MTGLSHDTVVARPRTAEIFLLNDVQIDHYWPKVERLLDLDPSLWDKHNSKESIYEKISDGQYQVWAVCNEGGAITTVFFSEILQYAERRDLHLWWSYGAGALHAPECVDAAVETFARHHGCEALLLTGRKGWERALHPLGWRFDSIVLRKPVDPVERRN